MCTCVIINIHLFFSLCDSFCILQTLSHSVAAAMHTLADLKAMDQKAKVTAEFVARFDRLFDCFNSSSILSAKPMKSALGEDDANQFTFLKKTLAWLAKVVYRGDKTTFPCIEGWKQNIQALLLLWSDLKENYSFKHLMTRHLNQDCLEQIQFRLDYREVTVDNLTVFGTNPNCEGEEIHLLLQLSNLYQ